MDNISKEIKSFRMNEKKMLKIKSTLTEMKNAFDGLINRIEESRECQ